MKRRTNLMAANKKTKEPLPKNFWDVVEGHLPNYSSREDVAENNDLETKKDNCGVLSTVEARRLDSLNRKLYKEALAAKGK
jgi:hypothetical protein